jgi:molybdopterin synthase sulfur carrier subunit
VYIIPRVVSTPVQVECHLFGPFRESVGRKELPRELPADATLGELLGELEAEYDGLAGELLDDDGLDEGTVVTVNGKHAKHIDGVETTLSDGDVVRLTPPVYGG